MNKAILQLIASKLAALIGGPFTWLWTKILFYGGQAIIDLASDWARKLKRTAVQEEKKKELDKVDKDPTKTPDDLGKSYEDYINSGRN